MGLLRERIYNHALLPGQRLDEALQFIFGDAHEQQIVLLVKDTNGAVLHANLGQRES